MGQLKSPSVSNADMDLYYFCLNGLTFETMGAS